jgi:hypothetical protein
MNEKIESLLSQKPFQSLSQAEKEWVLAEMSQQEYDQRYSILQASRKLDAHVVPPADLENRLRAHLHNARPTATSLPVWSLIAAFISGMIAMLLCWPATPTEAPIVAPPPPIVLHDTIFLEKTVTKIKYVYREKQPTNTRPGDAMGKKPEIIANKTSSTSVAENPELMQFFTKIKR